MAAAKVLSPSTSPRAATPRGGHHDRWLEVALGDDLEQSGRGFGGQREVAELVDEERCGAGVEAHAGGPAAF